MGSFVPKKAPEWFCGDDKEWRAIRASTLTDAGFGKLRILSTDYDQLRAMKKDLWTKESEDGEWAKTEGFDTPAETIGWGLGMLGTGMAAGLLFASFASGWWMLPAGVAGGFLGLAPGIAVGKISRFLATPLAKAGALLTEELSGMGNRARRRMAEEIGPERLREIARLTGLAAEELGKRMREGEDHRLARRLTAGAEKMATMAEAEASKREAPRLAKEAREEVAELLRKRAPEAFAKKAEETQAFGAATLEGRLTRLGSAGEEGIAAVSLWRSMRGTDEEAEAERRRHMEERLPRLLAAFESVPEDERSKPNADLDGETPEGSLRRGLAASLEAALRERERLSSKGKIATEAEARVLEAARMKR